MHIFYSEPKTTQNNPNYTIIYKIISILHLRVVCIRGTPERLDLEDKAGKEKQAGFIGVNKVDKAAPSVSSLICKKRRESCEILIGALNHIN